MEATDTDGGTAHLTREASEGLGALVLTDTGYLDLGQRELGEFALVNT